MDEYEVIDLVGEEGIVQRKNQSHSKVTNTARMS